MCLFNAQQQQTPKKKIKTNKKLDKTHQHARTLKHTQPDKQERGWLAGRRHIKVRVGQAVRLKQDIPLFLASM